MARRPSLPGLLSSIRGRPPRVATEQIHRSGSQAFGGGAGGAGPQGDPGRMAGFLYTYLTDTALTDPGFGGVKFNSTTFASVNSLRISETDADGNTLFNYLATLDDPTSVIKGYVLMRRASNPATFALFSITGTLTDNGTWDDLGIAHVVSAGSFANTDLVYLTFLRTGDKGDQGIQGNVGPQGPAGTGSPDYKDSVRVATTANIAIATALNSGDVIDGITLANGERVLVKNQTIASENGIYNVAASPARSTDADAAGELSGGTRVYVEEGIENGDSTWAIETNGSITPGTTAHTWRREHSRDHGLVTALPTTPAHGDLCTFTDSRTSPTYRWRLQYNALSVSSLKWECIGGTPMSTSSDTARTLTNQLTYASLPTDPLSIIVPLAGDYDVQVQANIVTPATSDAFGRVSYSVGGTAASDNFSIAMHAAAAVAVQSDPAKTTRQTGLAASDAITEKALTGGNYTMTFRRRRLWVMPERVG